MKRVLLAGLVLAIASLAPQPGVEQRLATAQARLERGEHAPAEQAYRALLDDYPALIDALFGLATALHRQDRTHEAVTLLLESGQTKVRAGDVEAGIVVLGRALELAPHMASAHAAFGHACLQADRHGDAVSHLRRAVELGETSPMASLYLGAALWESGDYEGAEAAYAGLAAGAGPAAAAARGSLGGLRVFRGDFVAAIAPLGAALGDQPDSVQLRYDLARALEGAGRSVEAIELYLAAVEQEPGFLQAHYRLARLYRAAGDARRAARHLETFSALHAEHQASTRAEGRLDARIKQGWSLIREGAFDRAQVLLADLPPGPKSLRALAEAQYRSGHAATARATLERVLAADPERLDLRLLLDEWRLEAAGR